MSNYKKNWEVLVSAKDFKRELVKHFSYLADNKGFDAVLKQVIDHVTAVTITDSCLELKFQEGEPVLKCAAPATKMKASQPEGLQNFLGVHQQLTCDSLVFGSTQSLDFGMYDPDDKVYQLYKGKAKNVQEAGCDAIDNYTNWLYHPTLKNSSGNEALFPVIHELENEVVCIDNNIGSLFLQRLVQLQQWDIDIPELAEIKPPDSSPNQLENWWEKVGYAIDDKGSTIFHFADNPPLSGPFSNEVLSSIVSLALRDITTLESVPFEQMPLLKEFSVAQNKKALQSISGIDKAKNLERLDLGYHKIVDITPLQTLTNLSFLNIADNKIKDISCLALCKNLEHLFLSNNPIKDIVVVAHFKELKTLHIGETKIKDITVLAQLPKLKKLDVPATFREVSNPGKQMDGNEYNERSLALGTGLNSLVNNLCDATDEEATIEEVTKLLNAAEKKIEMYEKLLAETSGKMHDKLKEKYEEQIEIIQEQSKILQEKYLDGAS